MSITLRVVGLLLVAGSSLALSQWGVLVGMTCVIMSFWPTEEEKTEYLKRYHAISPEVR